MNRSKNYLSLSFPVFPKILILRFIFPRYNGFKTMFSNKNNSLNSLSSLERVSNNRLFSVLIKIEIRNLGENGLFERLNGDRDNRESRFHGTTTISSVVTLGSEERRRRGEAKEPDQK